MRQFILFATFHIAKCECFRFAYKIAINHFPNWIIAQPSSWIFGIHSHTHSAQYGDGVWCHQRRTNWNRIKTRNMKLSIFDRNVYIRSLKLNGSTFNAYFKRFDRCETTFMWTKQKTNLELSVTESRWYNKYRKYEAFFFSKIKTHSLESVLS